VFRLETFFNPQSALERRPEVPVLNNGRALAAQSTNVDSSVAVNCLRRRLCGLQLPRRWHFTFGRPCHLAGDGVGKYDRWAPARRSDNWLLRHPPAGVTRRMAPGPVREVHRQVRPAAPGGAVPVQRRQRTANTAVQAQIGGDFAGGSVDAYYAKKRTPSPPPPCAAQVSGLATLCNTSVTRRPTPVGRCASPRAIPRATHFDNTTYGLMGSYTVGW